MIEEEKYKCYNHAYQNKSFEVFHNLLKGENASDFVNLLCSNSELTEEQISKKFPKWGYETVAVFKNFRENLKKFELSEYFKRNREMLDSLIKTADSVSVSINMAKGTRLIDDNMPNVIENCMEDDYKKLPGNVREKVVGFFRTLYGFKEEPSFEA